MAKGWESKPWVWFGIVVASGVVTAVVSNALSKWWGLKLEQQMKLQQSQTNTVGKYRAV